MTEDEARDALNRFDGLGDLETWMARQRWQATPEGWVVAGELQGWRFRLVRVADGLQVHAVAPGGGVSAV